MEDARTRIRHTLDELKTFLSQDSVPRLSEADTKAFFLEPLLDALGWKGIGVVTREYYVKNSQEFIDYVLFSASGPEAAPTPVLSVEAKSLQADLTDKYAAQLVQYCAVEGIEWAALTNARELQFFNTFLRGDLAKKRIMQLDLLAFNSDQEFDAVFEQLWRLSRESITTASVRTWLNQLRLESAIRDVLLDPASSTLKSLRKVLMELDVQVTPQELIQWFHSHLIPPARAQGLRGDSGGKPSAPVVPEPKTLVPESLTPAPAPAGRKRHFGVTLADLVRNGVLVPGTPIVFVGQGKDLAQAQVNDRGEIVWQGRAYRTLSDRAFAALLGPGRESVNGWTQWYAELPVGRVLMADLRAKFTLQRANNGAGLNDN